MLLLSAFGPEAWAAVQAADPLEVGGVLTGVACVWLAARNSLWNFPVAIVSCGLYLVVFGQARLYSDAGLQVAFIALSVYGWMAWLRTPAHARGCCRARAAHQPHPGARGGVAGGGWAALRARSRLFVQPLHRCRSAVLGQQHHGHQPGAQLLLSRRHLENWLLWIGVDVAYVGMYWHRHLYLTSGLYAVFLGLAAYGYWQWRRPAGRRQPAARPRHRLRL